METTTYIALSRQTALQRQMSVISHNLANLSTPAYRRESIMFEEVLRDTQRGETGEISFVQDVATMIDTQEGPMESTGNPLDLAISGEGYFVVETEEGPRYTRHGSFQLNQDGELVTKQGRLVLDDQGNAIQFPEEAEEVTISADGVVSIEEGPLATLDIVAFDNPQNLQKRADGLYDAGDMAPVAAEDAAVKQGMLEGSNVQGVVEMTKMMETVRSYQGTKRMLDQEHERQLRAIRTLVSSN